MSYIKMFEFIAYALSVPYMHCNLDRNCLPDPEKVVASINPPFGSDVMVRFCVLLGQEKSAAYWNLARPSNEEKNLAYSCLRNICADLHPTWQPEGFVARHPAPADEHVLHRVVEAMPHVQHRRDIRRRHHDHERFACGGPVGVGHKYAVLRPLRVPLGFG